ncbi:MAG: flagellar assembly protein A, partial [Dissulfurimicrobium sp.]
MKDDLLKSPAYLADAISDTMLEVFVDESIQASFMTLPPVGMFDEAILAEAIRIVLKRFNIDMPGEIYEKIRSGAQEKFVFQVDTIIKGLPRFRTINVNCVVTARNLTITGEPPSNGEDGEAAIYFDYSFMPNAVSFKGDSAFDLKDLQYLPQTKGNELLLNIYGPTAGSPGLDVFGTPILPKPGKPFMLELGEGIVEKTCASQDKDRSCTAVYSLNHGIIFAEFKDKLRRPQNLTKISILNHIKILPLNLTPANIVDYPDEITSMADMFVQGDIRGPISIFVNGNLTVDGAIECKKIEASKIIKANFAKTEAKAGN